MKNISFFVSFLGLKVQSFYLKGHYFLHEHHLLQRLNFGQSSHLLITDLTLHGLGLRPMLAVHSPVIANLFLQRVNLWLVMVLREEFVASLGFFRFKGGEATAEVLTIWVGVLFGVLFKLKTGCAVLVVQE